MSHDVIIIGGGISGISVAYHLLLNDYNGRIILLESRDRIGGRIVHHVTQYDEKLIEFGAQWIHGIMGNPIYELAIKHKIIDQLIPDDGKHIVEAKTITGETIDINIVEEAYRAYFYFVKKCENYYQLNDTERPLRWNNSVGKHLKEDINAWINGHTDNDATKRIKKSIFATLLNRETCISGCHSMDDVSLSDFGSYTELPGGNVTIPRGYSQILNAILDEINVILASKTQLGDKSIATGPSQEKQLSILKNHRVVSIKWKDIKRPSSSGKDDNPDHNTYVEVICENGSLFRGHHVVVTLPLGVLKREAEQLFNPKLPQYKLQCISSLSYGLVNKIFLEYSIPLNPFIDPNVNEIMLLWDHNDNPNDPNEPNDTTFDPNKWYRKIYSVSRVTNHCLLFWVSGQEAHHVEKLSPHEVNAQMTALLRQFLGNDNFPEADRVLMTKWGSDPFSSGSYTHVHRNGSIKDIELLAQPIYADPAHDKPIIVFGGEATHSSFYSTTHGAFLSGRKAAYYLLDADSSDGNNTKTKGDSSRRSMTVGVYNHIASNLVIP